MKPSRSKQKTLPVFHGITFYKSYRRLDTHFIHFYKRFLRIMMMYVCISEVRTEVSQNETQGCNRNLEWFICKMFLPINTFTSTLAPYTLVYKWIFIIQPIAAHGWAQNNGKSYRFDGFPCNSRVYSSFLSKLTHTVTSNKSVSYSRALLYRIVIFCRLLALSDML